MKDSSIPRPFHPVHPAISSKEEHEQSPFRHHRRGGIANGFHLPDLSQIEQAELVAVSDVNENTAKATAERWGARAFYTDHLKRLERDDVDACIVATWHPARGWFKSTVPAAPSAQTHRRFVECILKDATPKGAPEHARHVVEIMLAAYETEKTGQAVRLKTTF